jgi:hypothetical protein
MLTMVNYPTENGRSIVEVCLPSRCIAMVTARTKQETSYVIAMFSTYWRADCCLATNYKHS